MARGFFARLLKRYHSVAALGELLDLAGERVELEGHADPVRPLEDPLSQTPCVAIEYRAWPPSTTLGIDGGTSHNGRAYQLATRQATDFVFTEGPISVLVLVDVGEDVNGLHDRLRNKFGVGLRSETDYVAVGSRLRVAGRVQKTGQGGSPHRSQPHTITVRADRFWLVS